MNELQNFWYLLFMLAAIILLIILYQIRVHMGKPREIVFNNNAKEVWFVDGKKFTTETGARIRSEWLYKKGVDAEVVIFDDEGNPLFGKASSIFDFRLKSTSDD